jgi:hypothetical protein
VIQFTDVLALAYSAVPTGCPAFAGHDKVELLRGLQHRFAPAVEPFAFVSQLTDLR